MPVYNEYDKKLLPRPRRGMTTVEVSRFLGEEFPQEREWTCWFTEMCPYQTALSKLVTNQAGDRGAVGSWTWKRVKTSYPGVLYWNGEIDSRQSLQGWVGAIRVENEAGQTFVLFSYLSTRGDIGSVYFASTRDWHLLDRFGRDITSLILGKNACIRVDVVNGEDLHIPIEDDELLVFPDALKRDITTQTLFLFEKKAVYEKLGIRHRRGLLFVGPPGNGKTMMVRHLIRVCHRSFSPAVYTLEMNIYTDQEVLSSLFKEAAERAPSIVVLEDLDSMVKETKITRAGLLNELDGLEPREGILILATTNNPEEVDPALVHRPSRFDRVWHFGLPDMKARSDYLRSSLGQIDSDLMNELARGTSNWSFAYLNELRVTACIMAITDGRPEISEADIRQAFELLAEQFKGGEKNHEIKDNENPVGFAA